MSSMRSVVKTTGPEIEVVGYQAKNLLTGTVVNYEPMSAYKYSFMKGVEIPDFKARMKRGELLPHTPFEQLFVEGRQEPGVYDISRPRPNGETERVVATPACYLNVPWHITLEELQSQLPDDLDHLVQEAAAHIYSSGHDSLTFLAELHKVRRLFIRLIPRLVRRLRTADPRDWADLWLEARYGWRVLYYDIIELHDALVRLQDSNRSRFSERTGRSTSWVDTIIDDTLSGDNFRYTRETNVSYNISLRGSVSADVDPPEFSFNFVVTSWELVPFSFVLDWVLGVGSAIAALSFKSLSSNHSSSAGYRVHMTKQVTEFSTEMFGDWSGNYRCTASCEATYELRRPVNVSNLPSIKLNLDAAKVLDLLALLTRLI